jgi:hypothetical protein
MNGGMSNYKHLARKVNILKETRAFVAVVLLARQPSLSTPPP